ncbi:MAG: hypothetical protein AB1611_03280 [bacterium]
MDQEQRNQWLRDKLRTLEDDVDKELGYIRALILLMSDEHGKEAFDIFLHDVEGRLERISRKVSILRHVSYGKERGQGDGRKEVRI